MREEFSKRLEQKDGVHLRRYKLRLKDAYGGNMARSHLHLSSMDVGPENADTYEKDNFPERAKNFGRHLE